MKHLFRIALIIVFASTFGNAQVKLKVIQPALSQWQIPVANYRLPGKLDWTMSYMSLQAALDSVGISNSSIQWRGTFSADSSYVTNDLVRFSNSIYIFTSDMGAGVGLPSETAYADVFAEDGVDGMQGDPGAAGSQGIQGVQGPIGPPGVGVASGGTTGQILSKIDNTDFNTQWVNPSSGGGYLKTDFTSQTSVNVVHNFGMYPNVQVIDDTGSVFIPLSIVHNTVNDFTVTFFLSTTGSIISTI
jgi:hypothetical protein